MGFEHVWFVNGTAYAGKSTLVKALAEKYDGILCGENYHDALLPELDRAEFPSLCWSRDLEDWHDFVRRTPEEYEAWIIGVTKECEILELRILEELVKQDRPIFVDTNGRSARNDISSWSSCMRVHSMTAAAWGLKSSRFCRDET